MAASAVAVSVMFDSAVPFTGGVSEEDEKDAVTPLGSPVMLSIVGALKL